MNLPKPPVISNLVTPSLPNKAADILLSYVEILESTVYVGAVFATKDAE